MNFFVFLYKIKRFINLSKLEISNDLLQYDSDYHTKKQSLEDLGKEIDKNITETINSNAKANGYDLVLAKGAVLSGGTDITAEISKVVK